MTATDPEPAREVRAAAAAVFDLAKEEDIDGLIRELANPLETDNVIVRLGAIVLLERLNARQAVPHLVRLLHDDARHEVRASAAVALGKLGDKEVVPQLIRSLLDDHLGVRRRSAEALGRLGRGDTDALLALVQALDDDSPLVRKAAVLAIGDIDSLVGGAVSALERRRNDPSRAVRRAAKRTLARAKAASRTLSG